MDEDQSAAEQQHGQHDRQFQLAEAVEALGEENQHHDGDGTDGVIPDEGCHGRAPPDHDPARDDPDQHDDGRDHETAHRAAFPSLATSWWTTMTLRSRSIPSTKVLGATDRPPTSSTRRMASSSLVPPKRAGISRNPLRGCSPRARRRHRAAKTTTVSRTTWLGRLSTGTSHPARMRNRVAAWWVTRSARKAARAAAPAPANSSSIAMESSTMTHSDMSRTHHTSQAPVRRAVGTSCWRLRRWPACGPLSPRIARYRSAQARAGTARAHRRQTCPYSLWSEAEYPGLSGVGLILIPSALAGPARQAVPTGGKQAHAALHSHLWVPCRVCAHGGGVGVPAGPLRAGHDLRRRARRRRGPRDQPQPGRRHRRRGGGQRGRQLHRVGGGQVRRAAPLAAGGGTGPGSPTSG